MSFAFLPFYTGDFLRDTSDLTITEVGVYVLLLIYCWDSRGPVPPDEARASRIVRSSSDDERNIVKIILNRYFVRHDDGWYNPRMEKEIAKANTISSARSEAGKRGASRTWDKKKASAKASAMAIDMANAIALATTPTPTTTPTPSFSVVPPEKRSSTALSSPKAPTGPKLTPPLEKRRATRLQPDWRVPDPWLDWAETVHGIDRQRGVRISLVFRDFWVAKAGPNGCKLDWLATWRNWVRKEVGDA